MNFGEASSIDATEGELVSFGAPSRPETRCGAVEEEDAPPGLVIEAVA